MTSGKHSNKYVNKDVVYAHTVKVSELCAMIADLFENDKIEAVIAPAMGGIVLSQWVAYYLSYFGTKEVLALYADKEDKNFVIKRGYDQLIKGKRVLVVEDVVTTGGSIKKVIELVRTSGGMVIGAAILWNRGGIKVHDVSDENIKFVSLLDVKFRSWAEDNCPLCWTQIPINTSVGKGKEYLERKKDNL